MAFDGPSQCCALNQHLRSAINISSGCISTRPPMFQCDRGLQNENVHFKVLMDEFSLIPHTLVCDGRENCLGGLDESFCILPECEEFKCGNNQCARFSDICDGTRNCANNEDEKLCRTKRSMYRTHFTFTDLYRPWVFAKNHVSGKEKTDCISSSEHFVCPGSRCLTVNYYCNGVQDCPGGEDEGPHCQDFLCPGFYRCRGSHACIHINQLCDGQAHCPLSDDEHFCDFSCPHDSCVCRGWEFTCSLPYTVHDYPLVRYVNASRSGMNLGHFDKLNYLIHLDLSYCKIRTLPDMIEINNVRIVNLSKNKITTVFIGLFANLKNLRELDLSYNPITLLAENTYKNSLNYRGPSKLKHLKIAGIDVLNLQAFKLFSKLVTLDMSGGSYDSISFIGYFTKLEQFVFNDSKINKLSKDLFKGLSDLQYVSSDLYKLCCPEILPTHMSPKGCHAPVDEVSSCDNLLRSDNYRFFLWLFAAVAVIGNVSSLVLRVLLGKKKSSNAAFPLFVSSLSLADGVMGVYLTIIGVADQVFEGSYLWQDTNWKSSFTCKVMIIFN